MLWNSIATRKRAAKHGFHGFTEVDPQTELVRPVSGLSRSCKAVWNILQQSGARCHLLNWFASHPADPLSGSAVSDLFAEGAPPLDQLWPLRPGLVFPERLGPALPRQHRYKINFMQRPVAEVAASQLKMLQRRFPGKTHASPEKMAESLRAHRDEILKMLRSINGIELLEVSYPDLVRDPAAWAPRLVGLLAPRWILAGDKVAAVVKPELHRQRAVAPPR